jgi:hypothetical protein
MKTRLLVLIFFFTTANKIYADFAGYADSLRIKVESQNFIVIHFHDWTEKTRAARYKMTSTNKDPFTSDNNYAYIECIDKTTGKVVFKKPCSALTKIEISKDEKYIVGISNIMLWNPYQLVVFSTKGELIKKRHISYIEAKLTKKELIDFNTKFPEQYSLLESDKRIFSDSSYYYIDFVSLTTQLGRNVWDYLFGYHSTNHLSTNFSESVTNWVDWFYKTNPKIIFNYKENELTSISLLDPEQQRIEIKIKE